MGFVLNLQKLSTVRDGSPALNDMVSSISLISCTGGHSVMSTLCVQPDHR
jgi:hypothetical protein